MLIEAEAKMKEKYEGMIQGHLDLFQVEVKKLKSQFNETRIQVVFRDTMIK